MIEPLAGQMALPIPPGPRAGTHPREPIMREAYIEGEYRFWLRRAWGPGPSVAWIGSNPSTADARRDDPTMLAEMGFSYRLGFGSLVKLNVYPYRATDPADLKRWLAGWRKYPPPPHSAVKVHALALNWEIAAEEIRKCDMAIAAWGEGPAAEDVEALIDHVEGGEGIDEAPPFMRDWYCLALTASGAPRHTLARGRHFIARDAKPIIWRPAQP